jgi:gliding motility-associated-like protein
MFVIGNKFNSILMRKIFTIIIILAFSFRINASHISGGDINYTWVGPGANTYLITLNLFQDCAGSVSLDENEDIEAISSCGANITIPMTLINGVGNPVEGTEISQLCNFMLSTCNGGTYPGMQLFTYQATVDLSPACDTWTLSWDDCCRNDAANVPGSNAEALFIKATMNSVTAPQNNSPVFTSQPIPYVCTNQPVNYNYGVIESDGDSMSFQFISGYNVGGNLTYGGGFSGSVPIPGITINPLNGNISFTPTTQGNFIVVVQVSEYDDQGHLMSTTMRDIQFVVLNCGNQSPSVTSGVISNVVGNASATGAMELELCEGNFFSFTAVYNDVDVNDSLFISTNIGISLPGATFTTSGTNPLTVVYSWTVPLGVAGTNTNFLVNITDNHCPIVGLQSYAYEINVLDRTKAGPDQIICGTQTAQLEAEGGSVFTWFDLAGNIVPVSPAFSCNPCANPVVKPAVTTTYVVQSNITGCLNADTVIINVVPDFAFNLSQSSNNACLFEPIQLNCIVSPSGIYTYNWTPAALMSDPTIANPVLNTAIAGTYWVHNTVATAQGCIHNDSMQVSVSQNPPPIFTVIADTVCIGLANHLQVEFENTIAPVCGTTTIPCSGAILTGVLGTANTTNTATDYPAVFGNYYKGARHQIIYTAAELNAMGFHGGKITSIAFNITNLNSSTLQYNNFQIKMKCTNATSFTNWENGAVVVYPAQNTTVSLGWNTFQLTNVYDWDGVSNLIVETCFRNAGSAFTQNCSSTYTTTPNLSVIYYRDDTDPSVCNPSSFTSTSNKRPNIQFGYCGGVLPSNYSYTWTPTNTLVNPNVQNPVTIPPGSPSYQVIVTDIVGGCADTAVVVIQNSVIPPDPTIIMPPVPFYCINDPNLQINTVTLGGVWTGPGISATGLFNPVTAGQGNHQLVYTIYAAPTCFISDTLFMDVVTQPNASIVTPNNLQICITDDPFYLIPAVGGGVWSGTATSANGLFDPAMAGPGTFNLTYTLGSGNCISDETISITVIDLHNDSIVPVDPMCESDAAINLQALTSGGSWSGNGITDANLGTFDPLIATPNTHIVTYTYNGVCPFSTSMPIKVKPNPTVPNISNNSPLCERLDLIFTTTTIQNANYFWSGPNGFSSIEQNPVIKNVTFPDSGDYQLYIVVDACVSPTATILGAIWSTPPLPVVTAVSPICEGQTLYLETDSFPGESYFWSGPSGFSSTLRKPVIGYVTSANGGTYEIVKIKNGCSSVAANVDVIIHPTPESNFFPNPQEVSIINPAISISSLATEGTDIQYHWDFGDNTVSSDYNPNHVYTDTGTFVITYTVSSNVTGCESSTEKTVVVTPYFRLYIPSAFSPNNDNLNDFFEIKGNAIDEYHISVYNRWGDLVFQSSSIAQYWDGKINNGQDAAQDAYVYVINLRDSNGKPYEYRGSVTIIK